MRSSFKILTGLAAGVLVGLFFGEKAAVLDWAADGFVKLLQMTVLPYITLSIVTSLGRLDYRQARALGLRVGAVVAALWAIALAFAFAIPLAFPAVENATFFSTALVEKRPPFDFVGLYIPSNPFHSLAFNVVPAVVLFSALVGGALIGVERKTALLDVLQVAADAVARATRFVAKLTPFGLFAIAATAAGTLDPDQLVRLQVYLVTYAAVALLLSLWVLPGLIATLTPIPRSALLRETHAPLLTAFAAGDLFIVLPSLIDASKTLIERFDTSNPDARALPDVIVPASFNFPHSGKLLSISFILFAGWFSDATVPVSQYAQLALSGLVSFFGSLNAAVPFLLDVFRIPADTFQLFLATGVVNSRFGTLVAAVHTLAVAILGASALSGGVDWDRRRMIRFVATTAVLSIVVIGGARAVFATVLAPKYDKDQVLAEMRLREGTAPSIVQSSLPVVDPSSGPILDAIRERGALRVGYLPASLPFAFFNGRNELVGLDVELAHRLAAELGVDVQFVAVPRADMASTLADGRCDVLMSGVAVTTGRASQMLFSAPYLDETLGFLVPDHTRDQYTSWPAIAARGELNIGVPDLPYFGAKLHELLPRARLQTVGSVDEVFGSTPTFDAVALPAERGSAWTLLHPRYSMVVPEGVTVKVPLAYPVARRDESFAAFLNTWIDLKRKDGTLDSAYKYWILGQNVTRPKPRWAFARDVLHWIE